MITLERAIEHARERVALGDSPLVSDMALAVLLDHYERAEFLLAAASLMYSEDPEDFRNDVEEFIDKNGLHGNAGLPKLPAT